MFKIIKVNMVFNLTGTISLIIEKGVRRKAGPLIWTETLYKKAPLVLGGKKLEEMIPKCWLLLKWA